MLLLRQQHPAGQAGRGNAHRGYWILWVAAVAAGGWVGPGARRTEADGHVDGEDEVEADKLRRAAA